VNERGSIDASLRPSRPSPSNGRSSRRHYRHSGNTTRIRVQAETGGLPGPTDLDHPFTHAHIELRLRSYRRPLDDFTGFDVEHTRMPRALDADAGTGPLVQRRSAMRTPVADSGYFTVNSREQNPCAIHISRHHCIHRHLRLEDHRLPISRQLAKSIRIDPHAHRIREVATERSTQAQQPATQEGQQLAAPGLAATSRRQ
jgi:hypothetical protein